MAFDRSGLLHRSERGTRRATSELDVTVDPAASRDTNDDHHETIILDRVYHAVVPDANAPEMVSTNQPSGTGWPGVILQRGNLAQHTGTNRAIEPIELLLC